MQNNTVDAETFSYNQINSAAEAFLANVNPDNIYPINDEIWNNAMKYYKTKILTAKLDDNIAGRIFYDTSPSETNIVGKIIPGCKAVIFTSDKIDGHRKQFTIAHEFGHYILMRDQIEKDIIGDDKRDLNTDELLDKNSPEYAANVFAGCVLIPVNQLIKYIPATRLLSDDFKMTLKEEIELPKHFNVSLNVLKARISIIQEHYCI